MRRLSTIERRSGRARFVGAVVASALMVVGCTGTDGSSPTTAPDSGVAPSSTVANDPTPRLVLADGASVTSSSSVEVSVAGLDVARFRASPDPDRLSAVDWLSADEIARIDLLDGGYEMVFGEAELVDGSVVALVAGIEVDPTREAATSAASGGPQQVSAIGLDDTSVLYVRVETGRVEEGGTAGDRLVGGSLDAAQLDDIGGFSIEGGPAVLDVVRISRPLGLGDVDGEIIGPMSHELYLTLDGSPTSGLTYTLRFPGDVVEPTEFIIDTGSSTSPAIHVNQVGFRPTDPGRSAFFSPLSVDDAGRDRTVHYQVIDAFGNPLLDGLGELRELGETPDEWNQGDVSGRPVWELPLDGLDEEGRYRVCVRDVGCSWPFSISEDDTWNRIVVDVLRAAYHQRNGIALGVPYTSVDRPRPFHPEDGAVATRTAVSLLDDVNSVGRDDRFEEYVAEDTGEVVPDAWGGHFDAGDWNQHIQHLWFTQTTLDLVDLFPDVYADLDTRVPESGDRVPDMIDEGLWSLDLFVRLQLPTGGVPGGIDHDRFGNEGETSWDNSVRRYVLEPDVRSTYIFAAVAARAAAVVQPYDPQRAAAYADAAGRAMSWAEDTGTAEEFLPFVADLRAAAAASLLRITADDAWNDVFAEASSFDDGPVDLLSCHGRDLCEAAWAYARVPSALARPEITANVVESFVRNANRLLEEQATTAYRFSMEHPEIPAVWGLGPATPHGEGLLRAYVITGDERYRAAAIHGASYVLGANPLGTSFITGIGARNPRQPLLTDALQGGLPVFPGIPVFGTHDLDFGPEDDWVEPDVLANRGVSPLPSESPKSTWWYELPNLAMMNEFTMEKSLATGLWLFGVLGAAER